MKQKKKRNKYNQKHYDFIKENVVNTEKDLRDMFNKKFNMNVSVSVIGNLKTKCKVKSGLVGGRFEKGQVAFNKGLKWKDFMSNKSQQNSLKTCFKKGNMPNNHRPIGSERVNVYGYIEIKTAEPNKWKLKHRFIWEQNFGAIPKDKIVSFLDGNKQNCLIDNLELVSRKENLVMNTNQLYYNNAECTKSGLLLAKVIISAKEKKEKTNGN